MNSDNPITTTEAPNFFPFQSNILCADRHLLNGHRSALVWFTGLSGSGKSTLAHALEERLYHMGGDLISLRENAYFSFE